MRIRWFVAFFLLLVIFPTATAGFCQGLAQSIINGADSAVDAPATPAAASGGGSVGR